MDFEQLNNTIKNYLDNDKTNSAIMLTGEWGSGIKKSSHSYE